MKLRTTPAALASGIAYASSVARARPEAPILACLLITCDDGKMTITGTDMSTWLTATVETEFADDATVCVSAKILTDVAKTLPESKPCDITGGGGAISVNCGAASFTLRTMDADLFPALPATVHEVSGTVTRDDFATAAARTTVAVARDDAQPALTAVCTMPRPDGTIGYAATDRYRLADAWTRWKPATQIAAEPQKLLIPAHMLATFARGLPGPGDVVLSYGPAENPTVVSLATPDRVLTQRLVDQRYVPFANAFAKATADPPAATVIVDPDLLAEAVKRVAIVAETNRPIHLGIGGGQVAISTGEGELASGAEAVKATTEGELEIAFKAIYLQTLLTAIATPQVHMGFTGPAPKPVLITGLDAAGEPDPEIRYLLMSFRDV